MPGDATIPLTALILYALLLNATWEYAQILPLYTCWAEWNGWQRLLCPPAAIAGDVLIVLGVAGLTRLAMGAGGLVPQSALGWTLLLAFSFAASLFFEWTARRLQLWEYRPAMPTLRLGGQQVGLAPVAQITLLPAASLLLAAVLPL